MLASLSHEEKMHFIGELISEELLLKTDLAYFAEKILGLEISDHHEEWSSLIVRHKKISILAARDHGKSAFFSMAYVIWRAYHNWLPPVPNGLSFKSMPKYSLGYIFSNTADQAYKLLELVKMEIQNNEKLQHLIPANKESWKNKGEIRLSNGSRIRARGWGQSVRGAHPVWVVCDDVMNDETMFSEVTRNRQIEYFYSAVTPMLVPHGQLVSVGTPMHDQDLLYGSLRINKAYHHAEFPALDEAGDPLWPTRYNADTLADRKLEVGSTRFSREYLVQPISDDASLFPDRILRPCYDTEYEMPSSLSREDRLELKVYTGVDLATSATIGADFTVLTTIGVDTHGNKWIIDIRRKRGLTLTDQLREIQNVYKQFRPAKVYVEDNAFQRVFKDEIVRQTDIPVEGFTTTARRKHSFEDGVPSLQILFENRKVILPRKTERDREITDLLCNELKCFTYVEGKLQGLGAHDDMVMSLWLAIEASRSSDFSFSFT